MFVAIFLIILPIAAIGATVELTPRGAGEGSIGTAALPWGAGYFAGNVSLGGGYLTNDGDDEGIRVDDNGNVAAGGTPYSWGRFVSYGKSATDGGLHSVTTSTNTSKETWPVCLFANDTNTLNAGIGIRFDSQDGTGALDTLAQISGVIEQVSAGSTCYGGLRFYTSDGTSLNEAIRISMNTNIGLFGQSTFGTSANKVLAIAAGTAPTTSPADAVQLWAADRGATAGKASLFLRTEDGTTHVFGDRVGIGTLTPTADVEFYNQDTITFSSNVLYGPYITVKNTHDGAVGAYLLFQKSRNGGAVASGDAIGTYNFEGYQNGGFKTAAYFTAKVNGAPSGDNVPGVIQWYVNNGTSMVNACNFSGSGIGVTGTVTASGGFVDGSNAGIDTSFVDNDGNTITVSGGLVTAKTAP